MKSRKLIIGALLLAGASLSFQSCIGSFSLTNKVLKWNKQVSSKFVNEVVFFAFWVLPVYEVTAVADLLVINSIEFWSGNKPLEANNQRITTEHGDYLILADECGYTVKSPFGDETRFDFNSGSQTWSFSKNNGRKIDFLKFEDDSHVKILDAEGEFVDVELSQDGVDAYKAGLSTFLMAQN